ncbi:alpha-glucosidase (family GH31 glycosyl hydrolase) [Crossiella equi]|uniref:Alpha-glucosidase (Family GH31 glycosyl hydrolase) n=1 Tax=Crossiella equi TaxID=130796 RepID=A0ABS5A5P0_9PSEU|nr:discoidin domain-containing protein [Crossiella equi]MBP2471567.1 alpha-glucosidase (family GH31 glycosyl hydrolase) [Crossiella equi]
MRRLTSTLAVLVLLTLGLPTAWAQPAERTLGDITGVSQQEGTTTISAGSDRVRVRFLQPDVFRLWLGPGGTFTDPVGGAILTSTDFGPVATTVTETADYYKIETEAAVLRAYRSPLRFALYRKDNRTLVWQESTGLSWSSGAARQRLARGADEQFYGTGLRLGAWALRDKTVPVRVDNKWNEGGNASPAPFYLSTSGYGVVRNTWAPGSYAFTSPVQTTHEESRFDAVYFAGRGLKDVLDRYTDVTGKPFLAPLYGFAMGHADCWNASNPEYQGDHNRVDHQKTPDVLKYADQARAADFPAGWFLPNDGYGCGYTDLSGTIKSLRDKGFHTGLWTSTGLKDVKAEVQAGSRVIKTDVAWIGGGYRKAFEGVQQAVRGIEDNSDARRFVWTVDGWAGTQRDAVVWTGDTEGDWDNMRWHVPAITGAGLSALNYAAGDVDGIFAGSPDTYSRDLQWKAFTPALMSMSGWGAKNPSGAYQDKQPWRFDAAHQDVNRKYLKLRERLLPYLYSMSRVAHETGVPSTRAMVLEFPDDPVARDNRTSQQFMAGDAFLVAPVTSASTTRDGIHLPAGTWTDYWTGKVYQGPGTFDGYQAPLDRLPLFVRGGAIVPMGTREALAFDIHPRGESSFELYEDDGVTRRFQQGEFAKQQVLVRGGRDVTVRLGASTGSYQGKPTSRGYELAIHVASAPGRVTVDGADWRDWSYADGVLRVRTGTRPTDTGFTVTAEGVSLPTPQPIPTRADEPVAKTGWSVKYADSQETAGENGAAANAIDDQPGTMWHTAWSGPNPPHELQLDLGTTHELTGLTYLPRQDSGVNGGIKGYEVYVSTDGTDWGTPVAAGTFAPDKAEKLVGFPPTAGRYLRLRATSEINGGAWTSAAEIGARRLRR